MDFLKQLYTCYESTESQLDKIPEDIIKEIQKNIKKGAQDVKLIWSNALELVHKAYEVSSVQRPTPDMPNAWKQYEKNLQYAVEQLSYYRGLKGDWRMSSSVFHESMQPSNKENMYHVVINTPSGSSMYTVRNQNIDKIISDITDSLPQYNITTIKNNDTTVLEFDQYGIKKNIKAIITKLKKRYTTNF
jgi:hypothetical protein